MARYTKHNSNYIKTNTHQFLKGGSTIFERDWVTIGRQFNFGPGKIPYYRNGNFLFTTSQIPYYQKKHKNGITIATWTYEDVKDAKETVNHIQLDEYTEDIRSYAYYGSCTELVRTSIEKIIKTFPGNITVSDLQLDIIVNDEYITIDDYYVLNNPFLINTYIKDVILTKNDNILHYLTYSWNKYNIKFEESENFTDITSYDVIVRSLYERTNGDTVEYQMFSNEEVPEGWKISTCKLRNWLPDNTPLYEVKINEQTVIKGYIYEGQTVALVPSEFIGMVIQPKDEVIEEYFSNLKGFEKQLLTRKTNPHYMNMFVTPIEYDMGFVFYKRTYIWPSNGYCIDITSPRYDGFIKNLSKTAELLDELCTDNLWRRMTHEAIKNYDWTYTREYEDGEEEDNIEGGERMHKVINIIGRVFDDIKRTIDTIKRNNRITYNGDRNIPNALLSDKLENKGWDIYSTIPFYDTTVLIDGEEVIKTVSAGEDTMENIESWYPTLDPSETTFADVDIDFNRRLLLSSKRIFQTKGTRHSIDMIMGMFGYGNIDEENLNYTLTEEYYGVKPRKYDEPFDEEYSLGDKIVMLNNTKGLDLKYDEDTSGIPVGSFIGEFDNEGNPITYIIPFYNQDKFYDNNNLHFQSMGGWFYNKTNDDETETNPFNWTETLSYLHVVPTINELLIINPNSLREGDIYYVVNVNNYIDNTEEDTLYSHFFVLENDFMPELFSSWTNLDLTGSIYTLENNYTEEEIFKYKNYVKKAIYLNNIIPYTIGNNPHVGYGRYDIGKEYLEYMKKPFKYSIDNNLFLYGDSIDAEKISFDKDINGNTTDENGKPYWTHYDNAVKNEDKIKIFAETEENGGIIRKKYDIVKNEESNVDKWGVLDYNTYDFEKAKKLVTETYFLNSKVIRFRNLINNDFYKTYFKDVILKYIMQIIPSTAILVLENFELSSN